MSRVFAVLVAVALIVGAVLVRGALEDDDGEAGGQQPDGVVHVVCGEEVRSACDALTQERGYTVLRQETATTAAELIAATADDIETDVWVAPWPWPAIVDDARVRAGLPSLFGDATLLGRSDLAAVVPESIGPCDWSCLGERATTDLRFGGRPLDSGLGVLHLAAFAAGRLGRTDYASNDLDSATQSYLRALHQAVDPVSMPVTRMLQIRASFDVALTHRAEAERALADASEDRRAGLSVTYPEPVTSLVAVAVPVGDGDVPDGLADGMQDAGWEPAGDEPTGLPPDGVLIALLEVVG